MSTNIAMKAIMHDHLEEVSKDFYAGGFVVIMEAMEAMEAMLKERYGPDFPGSTHSLARNMVSDHAVLTLLAMVTMSHEALVLCAEGDPGNPLVKAVMEVTGPVYSITSQGQDIFND